MSPLLFTDLPALAIVQAEAKRGALLVRAAASLLAHSA
jgi:hypothetical protein